jgi:hypothetical protein
MTGAVKWAGSALAVLMVAAWIGSAWWNLTWASRSGWWIGLAHGQLLVGRETPATAAREHGWILDHMPFELRWHFSQAQFGWAQYRELPVWLFVPVVLIATIVAWRTDRRRRDLDRRGGCPKCGYDRRGIDGSSPCPECGNAPCALPGSGCEVG